MKDTPFVPKCYQESLTEIIPIMSEGTAKKVSVLVGQAAAARKEEDEEKHKDLLLKAVETINDHVKKERPEAKKNSKKAASAAAQVTMDAATAAAETLMSDAKAKIALMNSEAEAKIAKREENQKKLMDNWEEKVRKNQIERENVWNNKHSAVNKNEQSIATPTPSQVTTIPHLQPTGPPPPWAYLKDSAARDEFEQKGVLVANAKINEQDHLLREQAVASHAKGYNGNLASDEEGKNASDQQSPAELQATTTTPRAPANKKKRAKKKKQAVVSKYALRGGTK